VVDAVKTFSRSQNLATINELWFKALSVWLVKLNKASSAFKLVLKPYRS